MKRERQGRGESSSQVPIRIDNGRFVIDGKPTFLFGGEMHYFRVPRGEWRDRLEKLKAAGCNLVSTYVPWAWHEPEEGVIDLTGESHERRDLAGFLRLVCRSGLYCIIRPGPYVMAEVRHEGIPGWLLERYPEIVARRRDGGEHPARVVTYRHPRFLAKVREWYEAVNRVIAPMQHTEGGPVIMYQLCNEIGMLHWVTGTMDYSGVVLRQFAQHLEETYGTVDAFRERYGVRDESFAAFVERFARGLDDGEPSFHFEWGDFWRRYIKDYIGDLRKMALETGIRVPFIVNVHGFKDCSTASRGVDYPIGLSQLYRATEFPDVVLAGDFYPGHVGYDTFHDLVLASAFTRAVARAGQPLFSAEFQSGRLFDRPRLYPQDLDLSARTCIAHGMNAVNCYMFVAGDNPGELGIFGTRHEWQAPIDSEGELRPVYWAARHLGRVLSAIGPALVEARKRVHTFVGFVPDDYMTESVEPRDRALLEERIAGREHFMFDGIARLLVAANIAFEAVNLAREEPLDPSRVPSLWVFATSCMERGIQERLVRYVQEGGRLVLYPELPVRDRDGRPCTVLRDGLALGEWDRVSGTDVVDVLDIPSVSVHRRLRFRSFDGKPVAVFARGGAREVAAYHKSFGEPSGGGLPCRKGGEILVLGIAMTYGYAYQVDVVRRLAAVVGVEEHLQASCPDLSLVERTDGRRSFLFVNNYDEREVRAVLYENGAPLFEGEEVRIPPRSGAIFVRDFPVAEGVTIAYATAELTGIERRVRGSQEEILLTVVPVAPGGRIALELRAPWRFQGRSVATGSTVTIRVDEESVVRLVRA